MRKLQVKLNPACRCRTEGTITEHGASSDMLIGIICQNFPPASFEGGISHYSLRLAEALVEQGHRVVAITSTEFTLSSAWGERIPGLAIKPVKGPWNRKSVREIRRIAHADQLDALILQYSPASFKSSFRLTWALSRFPCQKVTAFHTLWGGGLDRAVGLSLLMGSDKIIATNSEIMTLLERHLSFFLCKTYWIPIGSNIQPLPRKAAKANAHEDPLFSYFGMLYQGKGLSLILDVLKGLKNQGVHFRFKFIGGGMPGAEGLEKDLQREILTKGLQDRVEHLGLIAAEEASFWIQASRFVFLPYDSGLSDRRGSFMAAIAHGKAVVTTPPAVDMAFLKNGVNVVWPEKTSVEDFLLILQRLLHDDGLVAKLEKGARELSQQFRWEKIAGDHELVLHQRSSTSRCAI
jgi:glycosyltransferase involved in cell wall biosynthesis